MTESKACTRPGCHSSMRVYSITKETVYKCSCGKYHTVWENMEEESDGTRKEERSDNNGFSCKATSGERPEDSKRGS